MKVILLDNSKLDEVWSSIENYLKSAAEHTSGRFLVEDLKANIPFRNQQVWLAIKSDDEDIEDIIYGVVISEVQDYPRMRVLSIAYAGGVMFDQWLPSLLEECQKFGKLHSCKCFEIYGRGGWGKMLKNIGAKTECSLFIWEIGDGPNNEVEIKGE